MADPDRSDGPRRGPRAAHSPLVPDEEELAFDDHVDIEGQEELAVVISRAVADLRDTDVEELRPTVRESVDTDGLERVFEYHPSTPYRTGWTTFFFADCRVVFDGNHRLRIYDRRPLLEA